jgi:tetratricopeptide (TPR) repeat protein
MTAAHILVSLRRFDEADAYYRRVLEIEPWNADATQIRRQLMKIGVGGNGSRKPEDVYAESQQAIARGDTAAGRRMLEKLLELHPKFALAHNDLGVICHGAGEKQRALGYYEAAVKLDPDNPTFMKNLADFYFIEQQRIEDALRGYVSVLEKNPEDCETLLNTGHVCAALRRLEDARVFYNRVLEIEPWNAEARRGLEGLATAGADHPAARSAESIHAQASRLAAAGDTGGALEALGRLAAAFPDFALGHNDLGVLLCRTGDHESALGHYERAVALDPGSVTFKKNLADLYWVQLGRVKDALGLYVDILAVQPEDVETLLATGRICVALKQFDDARVFFERALDIEPWNSPARQLLGEIHGVSRAA